MKGHVWKRCPCQPEELPRGRDGRPLACKRRHGTWSYRLDAGPDPVTGKRRRPSKGGFATREDAEAALSGAMAAVGSGTWTDDQRQTVGEYLDRWLVRKTPGLKPTTVDTYRSHIELHIRPELGRLKLRDLRPEHIYAMLQVVAEGRSAATVHRVRATLRTALAAAVKERLLSWNPARDLDMPREARKRVEPWTPAETGAFLDAVAGDRLTALFHVVAYLGLRRGEALGLRWDDVDLVRRRVVIRQQVVQMNLQATEADCQYCGEAHPGIGITAPKTDDSAAVVHLDAGTVSVLLSQQLLQGEEREVWGDAYQDHGLVFAREDGTPIRPSWLTARFLELQEGVTVPVDPEKPQGAQRPLRRVRLHDLRHGTASLMIAAGVDVAVVSKVLRHSTIKLTVDTYGHLLPGVGEAAAEQRAGMIPRAASRADGHSSATNGA
ncbi:Site-specific recombinase XerD [Micrococcus terreus]|uniref:Site-specific recombinase XerD n=2 Tax=Micrococcus terreus TaxID=574650 RepID=A0A1I7MSW8_9MICC|nr:Site-specific recombinase XerD [Micrococcus terreus]